MPVIALLTVSFSVSGTDFASSRPRCWMYLIASSFARVNVSGSTPTFARPSAPPAAMVSLRNLSHIFCNWFACSGVRLLTIGMPLAPR